MFTDRVDAGAALAKALPDQENARQWQILGIPRGGVVVAAEVARILALPLAVVHAVKVRAPWNPELAIGAVAEGIEPILDPAWKDPRALSDQARDLAVSRARQDLNERQGIYGAPGEVAGEHVVMIDDGAATGFTTIAAARSLRAAGVAELVVALPVSSVEAARALEDECDRLIVLATPRNFMAVGQFYREFSAVDEHEVLRLLGRS